jgi:hypothetical protein
MATTQERPDKPSPARPRKGGRPASDATGVNLDQRGPIDPRMPNAPPA